MMGSGTGVVPGRRFARNRRRRRGGTSPARAGESGVTLIELLVSVAIMGLAVITIAGALGASVRHSSFVAGRAEAEAEARRLAEYVRSDAVGYASCGPSVPENPYTDLLETPGVVRDGFRAEVVGVAYTLVGNSWDPLSELDFRQCDGETRAQRIQLRVVAGSGDAAAVVTVVKREP